jgi:hypothetical protein
MILDPAFVTFDEGRAVNRSWVALSLKDQRDYLTLKSHFHNDARPIEKDRNGSLFREEVHTIIEFVNYTFDGREHRAIVCGIASCGPFLCVNVCQLKNFIGRCKSSLNASFRKLGFSQVDTKRQYTDCLTAILPTIASDPSSARQWTVRHRAGIAGETAISVFYPPCPSEAPLPPAAAAQIPSLSISSILVSQDFARQMISHEGRGSSELACVIRHTARPRTDRG